MVMRALKLYFHKILPQAIDEDSLSPKWYHQAFSNESIDRLHEELPEKYLVFKMSASVLAESCAQEYFLAKCFR